MVIVIQPLPIDGPQTGRMVVQPQAHPQSPLAAILGDARGQVIGPADGARQQRFEEDFPVSFQVKTLFGLQQGFFV